MNKGMQLIKCEKKDLVSHMNAHCYEEMFYLCICPTSSLQPIEIATQERNLCYLDLANTFGSGRTWQRYLKDKCIRIHPPITAEYLMTETVGLQASLFKELYIPMSRYHTMRTNTFNKKDFIDALYMKYETRCFKEINTRDNLHSIEKAVRGMLFIYRLFNVQRFRKLYVPLLRVCATRILDPALTMELLRTLCTSDEWKIQAFRKILDDVSLQNMIRHASEMRFTFWGIWQGNGHLCSKYNPVVMFIASNKYSKANILLKYGFPYTTERVRYICSSFALNFTRKSPPSDWFKNPWCFPGTFLMWNRDGLSPRAPLCSSATFPGRCKYIYRRLLRLLHKKSHIRVMLMMETFRAYANFEDTGVSSERISTLVSLTRSLPDPYVTPAQISSELGRVFHPFFSDEFNRTNNAYNDTNIFDTEGGHRVYKPRRLLHLSRCAVRKVMVSNLRLVDDVDELNIPQKLKPYLKLEE